MGKRKTKVKVSSGGLSCRKISTGHCTTRRTNSTYTVRVKPCPKAVPMLNGMKWFVAGKVAYHETKKRRPKLKLVFKDGMVDVIKQAKGWKTDAEMARHLEITRGYLSKLKSRDVSVSQNIMIWISFHMNNFDNWGCYYEMMLSDFELPPKNDPIYNMEKLAGRVPYEKYSGSASLREKDFHVETA